jgi:hypothetical protein
MSAIQGHIRQAIAHERAAGSHDDKYEQQMKSAGAEMYAAFEAALRAAPEYKGRQIDDKAIARIYQSPTRRPWWDKELAVASIKAKDRRDYALRLIQWHLDPSKAQANRGREIAYQASARLKDQRVTPARGKRPPQDEPTPTEAAKIAEKVSTSMALDTRAPAMLVTNTTAMRNDARRLLENALDRVRNLAGKASIAALQDAAEHVEAVANDLAEDIRQGGA